MPRLVAFLRAINVGGHTVTMDALRRHFLSLGLKDVETFIASGNVVFSTASRDVGALEGRIEAHLEKSLGYEVKTFLRTMLDVATVAAHTPFEPSKLLAAGALNVGFLTAPLDATARKVLMTMRTTIDDFHAHDREVYWLCTRKQSESKFSNAAFERALKVRATFRSANTVARIAAKWVSDSDS